VLSSGRRRRKCGVIELAEGVRTAEEVLEGVNDGCWDVQRFCFGVDGVYVGLEV
jgi:hypothetical protein